MHPAAEWQHNPSLSKNRMMTVIIWDWGRWNYKTLSTYGVGCGTVLLVTLFSPSLLPGNRIPCELDSFNQRKSASDVEGEDTERWTWPHTAKAPLLGQSHPPSAFSGILSKESSSYKWHPSRPKQTIFPHRSLDWTSKSESNNPSPLLLLPLPPPSFSFRV